MSEEYVKYVRVYQPGSHTWEAVINVPPDRVHELLNDTSCVFIMKAVRYGPNDGKAVVTLVPGNGVLEVAKGEQ